MSMKGVVILSWLWYNEGVGLKYTCKLHFNKGIINSNG